MIPKRIEAFAQREMRQGVSSRIWQPLSDEDQLRREAEHELEYLLEELPAFTLAYRDAKERGFGVSCEYRV